MIAATILTNLRLAITTFVLVIIYAAKIRMVAHLMPNYATMS